MNRIKNYFQSKNAVSPVIGVMLMIVVTVILAAAVSSYSGGFASNANQKAPSAVFEVQIKKAYDIEGINTSFMTIKQITGDSIDTKNLKIVTSYTDAEGQYHVKEVYPNVNNTKIALDGSDIKAVSPYWNNPSKGKFGIDKTINFGNYVLSPGLIMIAQCNEEYVKQGVTGMDAMIDKWSNIKKGHFISVTLVHTPSNKPIFETEVEVS